MPGFAAPLAAQVVDEAPQPPAAATLTEDATHEVRVENEQPPAAVEQPPAVIVPRDYLVIPAVGIYGRMPIHRDPLELAIVTDTWERPTAGDSLTDVQGARKR